MLWHLVSFALALTLPIFVFMSVILWKYSDSERVRMQDNALTLARSIASDISQETAGLVATAEIPTMSNALQQGDLAAVKTTLDAIQNKTGLTVVLRDSKGTLRAAPQGYDAAVFSTLPTETALGGDDKSDPITVSNFFTDPVTRVASVLINLPVSTASDKDLRLSVVVPATRLLTTLDHTILPKNWTSIILDGEGVILARSHDDQNYVGRKAVQEFVDAIQAREGTWSGHSRDGRALFVAFSRSRLSNWQVAVAVSQAELNAPLRQSLLITALTGISLAFLALVMAWTVGRRMIEAVGSLSMSTSLVQSGTSSEVAFSEPLAMPARTAVKEINIFGQGLAVVSRGLHQRGVELDASKERLAYILDATPNGIIEIEADGRVTYANHMLLQLLNRSLDQVVGHSYLDLTGLAHTPEGARMAAEDQPLYRALRGESCVGIEVLLVGPGLTETTLSVNAEPLRAADGSIIGALAACIDISDRVRDNARRRQIEARLRSIVEAVPVGILLAEAPTGRIIEGNAAIETILQHPVIYSPDIASYGQWKAFHEDGRQVTSAENPLALALSGMDDRPELECRYLQADGSYRWIKIVGAPLRNETGSINGALIAVVDIDDIKRVQEHQLLMNRELHHRVKNTLATVQSIANLTARSATDVNAFRQTFADRIVSLSRTHTLLVENSWARIPLSNLVRIELDPYRTKENDRASFEGENVWLPSDIALALGMAFHELTTNAVKFGALSVPEGRVRLIWNIQNEGNARKLSLYWQESNGPQVTAPARTGFGSQLFNNILTRQLNGDVDIAFEPHGLSARITLTI